MSMINVQMKNIKEIIIESLSDLNNKATDEYINQLKSILYFLGKAVLTLFIHEDIFDEVKCISFIDNELTKELPNIFSRFEEQFPYKNHLTEYRQKELIKTILDIDRKALKKISLGELYQELITSKEKKLLGQVYTPNYITKYMVSCSIREEDIINNPYFRVIDPACGGGYFLIEIYDRIKNIIRDNYEEIISKHESMKYELKQGVHSFILKNNIWGADIDEFAVFMTLISLLIKDELHEDININIYSKDILLDGKQNLIDMAANDDNKIFNDNFFNLVIGNPPYIGHKKIDNHYRSNLSEYYSDVYYDKSDISYCFFKKAYELLNTNGRLIFLTSRYFQEAPSAQGLRRFIKEHYTIENIIDFYGKNVFKGVGVTPVIIQCIKKTEMNSSFRVFKLVNDKISEQDSIEGCLDISNNFMIYQESLKDSGWILMNDIETKLFNKIEEKGNHTLNELCVCNQGIITGCDKAFIVEEDTIKEKNLEEDIIKPWIKNSQVRKYMPLISTKYILYTDKIYNVELYNNTLNHIKPYKDKLVSRRECRNGMREWYQLQWGRSLDIFNRPKILFPFKSRTNEFTLSYDEICCSADVYIMSLSNNLHENISLEFLLGYLNSSLFEFYFKSVAKKLNDKMYEYYPNKLMNLKIRIGSYDQRKDIEALVSEVIRQNSIEKLIESEGYESKENLLIPSINNEIKEKIERINNYFYSLYELSNEEIKIIEERIC